MKKQVIVYFAAAGILLFRAGTGAAETATDTWISGEPHGDGLDVIVHAPEGFTSRVELYHCPDLRSGIWTVAVENLRPVSTSPAVWYTSLDDAGFFMAGNMDVDTDSDNICDAREIYVHQTGPDNPDSDDDLISDYQELYVGHTDPNNNDVSPPLVWLTAPEAGIGKAVRP